MQVMANTLRAGHVFEYQNKLWVVIRCEIMIPGKGNAIVQIDMRDARTGTKSNVRFRTQESVEKVFVEDSDMQFLYGEGDNYTFMDQTSYEQLVIPGVVLGDKAKYLTENMVCKVRTYEGNALSVDIPQTVVLQIVEADPHTKGQTATASYKAAKMSNGMRVMVPPFIESGEKIVINTDDDSYIERAKG